MYILHNYVNSNIFIRILVRGPTFAKIAYEILKSFDFIEIKMISGSRNQSNTRMIQPNSFNWAPIN